LGLILSKRLANSLGGDIVLSESNVGVGSTFCVTIYPGTIKLAPAPTRTVDAGLGIRNSEKLKDKKILVVDDSPDNQALMRFILKVYNPKLEVAMNGQEAIDKAHEFKPDIILMDLQMPKMGGLESTENLRKLGFKQPIIALSAHAMKEERDRCLASGFDFYLTKPIDRHILLETLISKLSN
jgi:CheY-like chemotaxis protein